MNKKLALKKSRNSTGDETVEDKENVVSNPTEEGAEIPSPRDETLDHSGNEGIMVDSSSAEDEGKVEGSPIVLGPHNISPSTGAVNLIIHNRGLNLSTYGNKVISPVRRNISRSEKYSSPTHAEKYSSPTHAEKYSSPTHAEKYSSPTHAEKYSSPTHAEKYSLPTHAEKYSLPTHAEKYSLPTHAEKYSLPTHAEKYSLPTHAEKYNSPPTHAVKYSSPPTHAVKYSSPPMHAVKYSSPPTHAVKYSSPPTHAVKYSSPPTHAVKYSSPPTHAVKYSSPPTHAVKYSSPPTHAVKYSSPPTHAVKYSSPPTYALKYSSPPTHAEKYSSPTRAENLGSPSNAEKLGSQADAGICNSPILRRLMANVSMGPVGESSNSGDGQYKSIYKQVTTKGEASTAIPTAFDQKARGLFPSQESSAIIANTLQNQAEEALSATRGNAAAMNDPMIVQSDKNSEITLKSILYPNYKLTPLDMKSEIALKAPNLTALIKKGTDFMVKERSISTNQTGSEISSIVSSAIQEPVASSVMGAIQAPSTSQRATTGHLSGDATLGVSSSESNESSESSKRSSTIFSPLAVRRKSPRKGDAKGLSTFFNPLQETDEDEF